MQKIVRTVDTVKAFEFKRDQLLFEMENEQTPVRKEIADNDKRLLYLKSIPPAVKFFSKFMENILLLIVILAVAFTAVKSIDEDQLYTYGSIFIVVFFILYGYFVIKNGKLNKAYHAIQQEIESLIQIQLISEEELERIRLKFVHKIQEQQAVYNEHMLNQVELLEEEIQVKHQIAQGHRQDEKECPKCAETIKFKALVCRYCGYHLESF